MAAPKCPCCSRTLLSLFGHKFRYFPPPVVPWWRPQPAQRFSCANCGTELSHSRTLAGHLLGLGALSGLGMLLSVLFGKVTVEYADLVWRAGCAMAIASNLASGIWGHRYVVRSTPGKPELAVGEAP